MASVDDYSLTCSKGLEVLLEGPISYIIHLWG